MATIGDGIVDRDSGPVGLGGWLIVYLIWCGLMATIGTMAAISVFVLKAVAMDFETAYVLAVSALFGISFVLFLLRKKAAKPLAIAICALIVAYDLGEIVLSVLNLIKADYHVTIQAARDCVVATAWGFYFLRSRRVENTLIN
jgi:hypothetical protein